MKTTPPPLPLSEVEKKKREKGGKRALVFVFNYLNAQNISKTDQGEG